MSISKINANQISFQRAPRTHYAEAKKPVDKKETAKKVGIVAVGLTAAAAIALGTIWAIKKGKSIKAVKTEAARRAAENAMTQKDKIARSLPNAIQSVLDTPIQKGVKIGETAAGARLDGLTHAIEVDKTIAHLEDVDAMHRARHLGLIKAFNDPEVYSRANFNTKTAEFAFKKEIAQLGQQLAETAEKAAQKA